MKYLFDLNHPAHFHLFKHIIKELSQGSEVLITAKNKDVLLSLLNESSFKFTVIEELERKNTLLASAINILKRDIKLLKIVKQFKPDLLIGVSISITHVGKLTGTPSLYFGEDGAAIVPLSYKIGYPFANYLITPTATNVSKFSYKQIKYYGYQKLAYLHPNYFQPDFNVVKTKGIKENERFFLLRLSALNAHHDTKIKGISQKLKEDLITRLEKVGRVFITSEKPLGKKFDKYLLKISPKDIHHFLYYAELLISDSQSMSVEAAMLGTPSIRFSDFAGKIDVLEELEHKYNLTFGIKTSSPKKLYEKVEELLDEENLKALFQERKNKMLKEKINVTSFIVWLIREYPRSIQIMKQNPDYQHNFK